jgi:hypothetical protein
MGKDKAISGGFLPGRVWSARLLIAVWTVALGIAAVHGQDGANGVREKGPRRVKP